MVDEIKVATANLQLTANIVCINKQPFLREGLDVDLVCLGVGAKVTQGLLSGEIEYACVTAHPVRSAIEGRPLKYLAGYQSRGWEVWARPGIDTVFDLVGKTMAGTSPAGRTYLDWWLQEKGIDPTLIKSDDRVLVESAIPLMLEGRVDAAFFMPPLVAQAERAGLRRIFRLGPEVGDMPIYGLATSDWRLSEHRNEAVRMVRAMRESVRQVLADRSLALRLTRELGTPEEIVERCLDATLENFDTNSRLSEEAQQKSIRCLRVFSDVKGEVPLSQVFDFSLLDEALGGSK
jgi:ABC-type nitrate/sulfonate/bicarbonate transport system substrate-binding protein